MAKRILHGSTVALVVTLGACSSDDGSSGSTSSTGPVAETGSLAGMSDAHNRVRRATGNDLPPLDWDAELAGVAQAWSQHLARRCQLTHSSNAYGENLYLGQGFTITPDVVVDAWAAEAANYTFGPFNDADTCAPNEQCGHYTQIVWRATRRVGCGTADCDDGSEIWTCNYDPPGNFIGQDPY